MLWLDLYLNDTCHIANACRERAALTTVELILEKLAAGETINQVLQAYL